MAKFSTKKLGKQIDKWTSGYYSSGYKSSNKNVSNSSFWINDDFLQDIPKGADYIRLAGYKRAISNFVRIVTGKDNIPVVYQATGNSYTNGKAVVISSKLDENQFDPTVGLALHEGSHIALTDFKILTDVRNLVDNELHQWVKQTVGATILDTWSWCSEQVTLLKDILNVIEDRRIDKFVYDSAPGYQGYYQAMYDTYFNAPVIDRALKDNLKISRSWDDYMFHIVNFVNPNRQLDCMPGLRDIWNTIDIKNISRLKSTHAALLVAVEVWKLLHLNVLKEDEQGNGNGSGNDEDETNSTDPEGSGDSKGDKKSDDNSSGNGGSGGDMGDEDDQPGQSVGTPLSSKEQAALAKALAAQADFLKGAVKKKGLSKSDANKVNAAAESNMNYAEVGGDITTEDGSHFSLGKTNCVVVKGITNSIIESDLLGGHCTNPVDEKERVNYRGRVDYIAEGIQLGILLGKRLKTRDEERTVKTLRLESGKMDRRLINELGFGNERVFSQVFHNTVTPSLVHVSIDASGSMHGDKWHSAMKTAVAIAKAGSMVASLDVIISVRGSIGLSRVGTSPLMWIVYDSRTEKFNAVKDKLYAVQSSGSTPEGLCYQAVMQDIIKSANGKEAYFINICDGEPCYGDSNIHGYSGTPAIQHTKAQVNKIRQAGIKVLSFFVDRYTNRDYISTSKVNHQTMYGKDAVVIDLNNLTQLSKSINSLFERNV